MLQLFYLDVTKLDLVYVAMAIHTFRAYVSSVSFIFSHFVTSVSTGCFKSRSGGAHVQMAPMAGG
jgi:hypothetical protein